MKSLLIFYLFTKLLEVQVFDVIPQKEGGFLLILKQVDSENYLPIGIGDNEGISIIREIQKIETPRPMTYELTNTIIEKLGAEIEKVIVDKVENGIFYAKIHLKQGRKKIIVDSRPSDAVNIAVRKKVKIFVEKEVFDKMGVQMEGERKKKEGIKI